MFGGSMDERLIAGRHHLANGERALSQGYMDDGRSHFEAALIQFRGPELRLGEAHALRGLAHVELGCGKTALAEETVQAAIRCYQDLRHQLRKIDLEGISHELRHDAEEGEGVALVLLGDLLVRSGRGADARQTLSYAREIFQSLGNIPSSAGVWAALGRLDMRTGRHERARDNFIKAVKIHEQSGNLGGQCSVWLAVAELDRGAGLLPKAEQHLDRALSLARESRQRALEGRTLSHLGSLMLQIKRLDDAESQYQDALPLLRDSGDAEMEGYALIGIGDAQSRKGSPGAVSNIGAGAQILGSLEHFHGLGAAMLVLANHAYRFGKPDLALVAAESARQLWYGLDPERGVGQALRVVVKSLAALREWRAVVRVSHYRAAVAAAVQPNAVQVRDFYRERAPQEWLTEVDSLDIRHLEGMAETDIHRLLEPICDELDLFAQSLGTVGAAMAIVDAVLAVPLSEQTPPIPEAQDLPASAIEELPPEQDAVEDTLPQPDSAPVEDADTTGEE